MLTTSPIPDVRRVASSLAAVRGRAIREATFTTDLRQLRLVLDDGDLMVIRIESDDLGRSHLEVDVVRPGEHHQEQLELESSSEG